MYDQQLSNRLFKPRTILNKTRRAKQLREHHAPFEDKAEAGSYDIIEIAVQRTVEAIAQSKDRILLTLLQEQENRNPFQIA